VSVELDEPSEAASWGGSVTMLDAWLYQYGKAYYLVYLCLVC
jgi:hypothetical protein